MLSLVSFFAVTAMWASLTEAYKIYVTAPTAKTNSTAELTLSVKNRNAIGIWSCELVLPAGVTFESFSLVDARYPEAYEAEYKAEDKGNGVIAITVEGADGVAMTGTDGAAATVTVKISDKATVGENTITVQAQNLYEPNGTGHTHDAIETKWTIEQGEPAGVEGDANGDGEVTIDDVVAVLTAMANDLKDKQYDVNKDGEVTIDDVVAVLTIMANK